MERGDSRMENGEWRMEEWRMEEWRTGGMEERRRQTEEGGRGSANSGVHLSI
jgi:hypothetical protein